MIDKNMLKKIIAIAFLGYFIFPTITLAANSYAPLTTIPGAFKACISDTDPNCVKADPVAVIKNIYGISISVAATLAVAMIIWAGIQYATTEAITGKSDAKSHWEGAIWGLVLLLSAYLILRTINIDLVRVNLDLGKPLACTGYLKDTNGETLKDAGGNPVPCSSTSASVLSDTLTSLQSQVNTMVSDSVAKQKAVDDAEAALETAKKTGDSAAQAAAQKAVDDAVAAQIQSTSGAITTINTTVDSAISAAQASIPAGVKTSMKSDFAAQVAKIDSTITDGINTLKTSLASATTDAQKELITSQILNLNDKKTMADTLLEDSWRTEMNIAYSSTQTDSLAAFQQTLIKQRDSIFANLSNPNTPDAVSFKEKMNNLILKIGNTISSNS